MFIFLKLKLFTIRFVDVTDALCVSSLPDIENDEDPVVDPEDDDDVLELVDELLFVLAWAAISEGKGLSWHLS